MKEWISRRKVFCIVVVILLLVVFLWPISLGSRVPEDKDLVISWHQMDGIPPEEGDVHASLNSDVTTYLLEVGSEERSAFQDLLEGYTIHRTWRTPFPSDGLNGHSNGGYLFISWTEDEQFVHQVVTGFDRLVMVEDHVYSLGYLNQFLSLDMKERTLAFLGHCTPLDES